MKKIDPVTPNRTQTETGELFESNDTSTRIATGISMVANPLFVALPLFLAVALYTAPSLWQGLVWWIITVLGMTVAPYLFILRGIRSGKITDHHVSDRTQRLIPLTFGLICMIAAFAILIVLHATGQFLATATAVIVVLAGCIAVTQIAQWKISLHASGMAGAVTIVVFIFGPMYALLGLLLIVIGWARWQVRAHTVLQTVGGSILAIILTVGIFFLFRIR